MCVGRQNSVVAMAMDARGWSEPGRAVEELEAKHFTAARIGLGEAIHQTSVRGGERLDTGGGVEPLQGGVCRRRCKWPWCRIPHGEGEDPMADEQELDERELNAILDRMIRGKAPGGILGQSGLVGDLTRRVVDRVLDGEMTAHLGYEKRADGTSRRQLAQRSHEAAFENGHGEDRSRSSEGPRRSVRPGDGGEGTAAATWLR